MAKAILELEMPESCDECRFSAENLCGKRYCWVIDAVKDLCPSGGRRPDCPLEVVDKGLLNHLEAQKEEIARLRELLEDILPHAKRASCKYREDSDSDPTSHCCDWNEIVERIILSFKGA